ncbi:kinesin-like protein KIF14 isoform X1 [Cylas formicarius]|uniref:kinesin-like protein KIF14 isoform X1 n=1 Tax=Cylas formicarius TaxID=197179 RepID=UPI0029586117|nr:kinesin-like protein KIF14 isoform X1 [Cylas formicarius]
MFSTPEDPSPVGFNSNYATPKSNSKALRNLKKSHNSVDTPDCFSKVILETPNKRARSKEKVDEVSNLIVAVRIRPMNLHESSIAGVENIVKVKNQELIISSMKNQHVITDYVFNYDHVFWSVHENDSVYANQEDVFLTIGVPLLNNAFQGFNACLLAYGQTGSGKSFSMMGKSMCEIEDIESEVYSGITPRFCRELFKRISELKNSNASVEVSYFQIYNEKIHDLLSTNANFTPTPLKVREHPVWGPYVVDLSTHIVKSYEELRNFLILGNRNRATAATLMNEKSSRSHSICSIELCLSNGLNESNTGRRSKVNLVDLAGSERLSSSHKKEDQIKEGMFINKSLLTLGKVISTLADQRKNQFVPYRESVLTWLLKESLGGNSLTSMLATISPASTQLEETLSTLRYACQARSIINRARINESPHDRLVRELRSEVKRLREDFEQNSVATSMSCNDSNESQLEQLKEKLLETENKLVEAQKSWEQRFKDSKRLQMEELAEAEKHKAELESKFRIFQSLDDNISVSPYKSNFLEKLENVLIEENRVYESNLLNIKNWCTLNGLVCVLNLDSLQIIDSSSNRETKLPLSTLNFKEYANFDDFSGILIWEERKIVRKLTKTEVVTSMNQIYQLLSNLKPVENDNLSLLYAKVNKNLQSFETALLNDIKNNTKSVTFDL